MPLPKIVHNKHFIFFLTALLLGITFYIFVIDCSRRALLDLAVYTEAASAFTRGENLYASHYEVVDRWGRVIELFYLYPPLLAQVVSKLLVLEPQTVKFLWCLLSFGCIVASAWCISELVKFSWWGKLTSAQRFLVILFLVLCFEPVYWGVGDGQVTTIILLLLSVFALAAAKRRDFLAGFVLALAVLIKMSPLILLLGVLRFKRWKTLAALISTCIVAVAWHWLDQGNLRAFSDFAVSLSGIAHARASREFLFNYVFDKSLLFPFGLDENQIARCIVSAMLIALPLLATFKLKRDTLEGELRHSALLICFMLICSPLLWFHHLTWALLPLAVLSCIKSLDPQQRLKHLTLCLGLYFALSQVNLLHYWTFREVPTLTWLTSIVPNVLLLLLAYFCSRAQGKNATMESFR